MEKGNGQSKKANLLEIFCLDSLFLAKLSIQMEAIIKEAWNKQWNRVKTVFSNLVMEMYFKDNLKKITFSKENMSLPTVIWFMKVCLTKKHKNMERENFS